MTVTLDLPPDVERAYLAEASARGVPVEVLVREVLLAHEPRLAVAEMTAEEWVREFKAWTRSHSGDNFPVLSDEAISRDFIYGDRGL
jgi:hypothetical protein